MKHLIRLVLSVAIGFAIGAVVSLLIPLGKFWISWLGTSTLLTFSIFTLLSIWNWFGHSKSLGWLILAAFGLRVAVGIGLSLALPSHGWDEPAQNAGYLFYDAYSRDNQAWQLAQSDASILNQTREEFYTDQYGGILTISALVYRVLSPDAHRAYLVTLLGAFTFSLGVAFFYKAVCDRWDKRLAMLASWFLVLYPDSILFTSSQMREPFVLGLSMFAFWAVLKWSSRKRWLVLLFFVSMALLTIISSRIALVVFVFLFMVFLLERIDSIPARMHKFTWVVLILLFIALLYGSWAWLQSSAEWDMLLTERGSGWVSKVIDEIGTQYRIPFLVIYGIAQPVLPATIAEPTLPLWKVLNIARASGWYLLAPLLIYAVFSLFRSSKPSERRVWIWIVVFSLLWIVLSSARAGGDQWDNPRYRANLLPWLVLAGSWAIQQAIHYKDVWLPRWLLVELVFLGFFTNWYFSRYFLVWQRMFFWEMVTWIVGLSAFIILGGLLYDRFKLLRIRKQKPDQLPNSKSGDKV